MTANRKTALRISNRIHGIEDRLDALLAEAGELMAEMTHYRIDTDMDANVGQRAIARVADLQGKVVEARMKAIGAHSDMKKIIEETADIPFDCPEKTGFKKPDLKLAS